MQFFHNVKEYLPNVLFLIFILVALVGTVWATVKKGREMDNQEKEIHELRVLIESYINR